MITRRDIEKVATQIGIASNAKSVILFGSYVRGDMGKNSDVDFLIIAESDLPRHKRSYNLYKMFRPYPFAMDILVYTPEEIEKAKASSVSFISRVLKEGEIIYESRNRDSKTMDKESTK